MTYDELDRRDVDGSRIAAPGGLNLLTLHDYDENGNESC